MTDDAVKITIETISPEVAAEWLEQNLHNRNRDRIRVRNFVKAMERGEWAFNGDAIRFDGPQGLLDGQHRLAAVAESGVTIQSVVIRGLPAESQETMDRGKGRTIGDVLKLRGEANYAVTAAALNWLWRFENEAMRSNVTPLTPQLAVKLLEERPALRLMSPIVDPVRPYKFMSPGLAWALAYQFAQIDFEAAAEFFGRLANGADLNDTHPIFKLREWFIKELAKPKGKSPQWYGAALTIKAWNAWREGRPVASLRFRISEPAAEAFPEPV